MTAILRSQSQCQRVAGSRAWVWLLIACLHIASAPAMAGLSEIDPGDLPELAADEGVLLVAVDSFNPLYAIRIGKDGRMLGSELLRSLPKGRSYRLFRATAGDYQWMEVKQILDLSIRPDDPAIYHFSVQAGRINYPGDLLFKELNIWRAEMAIANRALAALDWLAAQHPTLSQTLPFAYVGHFPDPFPDFYRQALKANTLTKAQRSQLHAAQLLPPGDPGSLRLTPEVLWQQGDLLGFELSPDGRFLALELRDGEAHWKVELIDLQSGNRHLLARSAVSFESIAWSGANRLLLEVGPYGERLIELIRIDSKAPQGPTFDSVRLRRRGLLVDALPSSPGHILFGSYTRLGQLMVHRVDMRTQKSADAFRSPFGERLNKGVEDDRYWMADGEGRLRLVVVEKDDKRQVLYGADGQFTLLFEDEAELGMQPLALSADGRLIYGTSDVKRDQRDLVAFDISARKITETLFSRPGVDVESLLSDHLGKPIGVNYFEGGLRRSEYFGADLQREAESLQRAFPGKSVVNAGRSVDGSQRLLWVEAADQAPMLYHLDGNARTASPVLSAMPWLDKLSLASATRIEVKTADGTALDAFLTLPTGKGPHPMVLFPHGGPIGIADSLGFDREVQFIAGLGYAVLQVNFRGSDGYGRAFREAGQGNFGRLIEDDLDTALNTVLASQPIDAKRLCVLGGSYGGYSALISSVRWPDRFRCAVSINGISDLPLHFTATDGNSTEQNRKKLTEIIGDPFTQLAELQAASPVYQYQRLKTPLMLVHGSADRRVDAENTRRMLRMMLLNGQRPSGLLFADQGHTLDDLKTQHALWRGVAAFLRQHLGTPAGSDAEPAAEPTETKVANSEH